MRKLSPGANRVVSFIYGMEKGRGYEIPKTISKETGISQSGISQIAIVLETKGLLIREKRGSFVEYHLTAAGELYAETLKSTPQMVSETLQPVAVNSTAKSKGVHKLMLVIPWKNDMTLEDREELAKPYLKSRKAIRNQVILVLERKGRTFELTASSLIVYAIPRFVRQDASIQALHDALVSDCLKSVEELEGEFNARNGWFKLRKRRKLGDGWEYDYAIVDEHIPYVNDEVAKASVEAGEKVDIKHPGTEKTCITVEHSKETGNGKPIPELEFKGAMTALIHAKDYSKLVDNYEHGRWDPMEEKERVSRALQLSVENTEANKNLMDVVLEIKDELKIHQSAYRALERMAKKIDRELSQRRL